MAQSKLVQNYTQKHLAHKRFDYSPPLAPSNFYQTLIIRLRITQRPTSTSSHMHSVSAQKFGDFDETRPYVKLIKLKNGLIYDKEP